LVLFDVDEWLATLEGKREREKLTLQAAALAFSFLTTSLNSWASGVSSSILA